MTISIRETDGGTRAATSDELAQIRTDINAAVDAADVSQVEAEAGTEPNRRRWSVVRVWQAAAAYVATIKGAVNGVAGLNGASEVPSANLPGIPGTGGVFALPLIKNQGASSAVALAMETFSGSMTKNGKLTSPTNPEQGVIQFGAGVWTMEKTCAINLAGAGVSRFGLCIRGQGDGSTILYAPASSSVANFRGVDNIWRMLNLTADASGKFERFRMEDIELVCYFTQGGDGSTRLSDALRIVDTDYLIRCQMRNVRTYARTITAQSVNQMGMYLKRAYYGNVNGFKFNSAAVPAAGVALNNASAVGYGGVGMVIDNCNSLQVGQLEVTGAHTAAIFKNELGAVINGYHVEHVNRAFHFEDNSHSVKVLNGYIEFHFSDSADIMLPRDQMGIATFGASTSDNLVTVANGQSLPRIQLWLDRSRDRSNKVVVEGQYLGDAFSAKPLTGGRTLSSVTVTDSTDRPADFYAQGSLEVAWPGNYGQGLYWTYAVDPRAGRLRVLTSVKRISGDGMMKPLVTSVGLLGANTIYDGDLLDVHRRLSRAGVGGTLSVAASGNSYSSSNNGEVTLNFTRQHMLQPGISRTTSGSIGSGGTPIATATTLYVRAVISETVAVFGLATGTLADPGTITSGTLTTPSDMYEWLGQPDASRGWLTLDRSIPFSFNVISMALDGANILTVGLDGTVAAAGITNNSKLMLWGFNDSRIDGVAYTALTADISGSTLKLNAIGALAGLDVTTAAANGLDSSVNVYGKIGFTEILVALIGKTNGTAACVWRMTRPVVTCGDSLAMPVIEGGVLRPESQSVADAATINVDAGLGDTVVVGALAGNRTIAAPTNLTVGQTLTYCFTQDGTGGRTLTWNAIFKKAADGAGTSNQRGVTSFTYDGTNLVQRGGALTFYS